LDQIRAAGARLASGIDAGKTQINDLELETRMGGSRFGWALGAIAPWWIGAALAVSMPAGAGQEQGTGASRASLSRRAPPPPDDLIPIQLADLGGALGRMASAPDGEAAWGAKWNADWNAMPRLLRRASLAISADETADRLTEEIEPRATAKRMAENPPAIDLTHRGDPDVGLRPTFDARLRQSGGLANLRAHDILFEHDDSAPVGALEAPEGDFAGPDSVAAFEPWADGETPTTAPSSADASPPQAGSALTMRPEALSERLMQGATPAVRRADALGSTTPAAADSMPVEVAAAPPQEPPSEANASLAPRAARQNYAALIGRDGAAEEKRCLAEAIYFEARGESEEGQAAVAQVVLNRVSSGLYPASICGVVYQNRQRRNACQFSFACDGRSLRVTEPEGWRTAVRIADEVSTGATYLSDVGGATHYHANYVRPRWARSLEKMDVIGHHIFYRLRPGQT
jgi:spore germination cell wall hydrolase CwlJ-like protein